MGIAEFVKDFFRKQALKKYSSTVPTGIIPLSRIKTAVTFIDVEDTSFDTCKTQIMAFYREHNIKGEIFFLDFRKIDNGERLITSIQTTILRRDLDWTGKPNKEKINIMSGNNPDLFISLVRSTDFPIEFMAKCSQARFKIGRIQLPGNTFDIVLSDHEEKPSSEEDIFKEIKNFLVKIN